MADCKMIELADFEKYVIRKYCETYLSLDLMAEILNEGANDYRYTGHGYYLTIKHKKLPRERSVCDQPELGGR